MIGDKLIIEQHHTDRAEDISKLLDKKIYDRFALSVAGESGAGKSELAFEIARLLNKRGVNAAVLQQDESRNAEEKLRTGRHLRSET